MWLLIYNVTKFNQIPLYAKITSNVHVADFSRMRATDLTYI